MMHDEDEDDTLKKIIEPFFWINAIFVSITKNIFSG
jgi:hypothetical protein